MPAIWRMKAWFIGLIVFLADFGTILGLRVLLEHKLYFSRWKAYWLGDSIFLPLYAAFAATAFNHAVPKGKWYTSTWYHLLFLPLGMLISVLWQYSEIKAGHISPEVNALPSEMWHTTIRGVGIWFIGQSFLALIFGPKKTKWAFRLALLSLGGYVLTFIFDAIWTDHSAVTLDNR